MAKDRIIAGIDIGSFKITTIIASFSPDDRKVSVIGVSNTDSRGIKKGVVVDIDDAVEAIATCLEAAERMAGYAVSTAFVTVDGSHISSLNSHGVVAVHNPEGEITEEDVARVTEAARAISLPSSREILHVIPRGFTVDSQEGVKDPVGMSGIRLEVETNIISGATTVMRNLVKCVQQVGVDVEDLVFSGIAAAEAVLSDTEKELGCILVDIGGGTSKICIFSGDSPAYASVLPLGGQNITNDLAIGLRTSLEAAEKIKLKLSQLVERSGLSQNSGVRNSSGDNEKKRKDDEIDISDLGLEIKSVPKKLLDDIIKSRISEIFSLVALEIKKSGYAGMLSSGIVVTGGAAETVGVEEMAKKILKVPFRIGYPSGVTGLIEEIGSPAFASSVGVIQYGTKIIPEGGISEMARGKMVRFSSRFVNWVRSFMP